MVREQEDEEGRRRGEARGRGYNGKVAKAILAVGHTPVHSNLTCVCVCVCSRNGTCLQLVCVFVSVCTPAVVNEFERSNASQKD